MNLTIVIPGRPVAQGRARATARGGFVRFYDDPKAKDWKRSVALVARAKWRREPTSAMVFLYIVCRFSPPKSLSAKLRRMVEIGAMVPARTNIDTDNMLKLVMDALKGIVYVNDHQVWWASVRKVYGEPGTIINVEVEDD